MSRDLLGPPPLPAGHTRAKVSTEFAIVVSGLVGGARHVWERRPAVAALFATAGQRTAYGVLLLASVLLYRNYFFRTSAANSSLAHFTLVVIAAAIGYGAAAVVIPILTRWMSKAACMAGLLVLAGAITAVLGPTFYQPAFLVISLVLGVVAQGVAICSTTVLQEQIEDSYRGRVFAVYDLLFNVPFVIGAAAAAAVIPVNGHSFGVVLAAGAGYVLSGLIFAAISRQELLAGPSAGPVPEAASVPAGPDSPSAAAQRSSS